jgi:hypothetical protein
MTRQDPTAQYPRSGVEGGVKRPLPRQHIPRSAVEARRKTPSFEQFDHSDLTERWLSPYEPEDTRSKLVGGIHFNSQFTELALKPSPRKGGVRGTLGSPVLTGMAQRQRAGLITPRSLDRNELPVYISLHLLYRSRRGASSAHYAVLKPPPRKGWVTNRGGAEEARGAHNPEVLGSSPSSGIFPIHLLYRSRRGGASSAPPLKPPPRKGGVRGTLGSLLTSRRSSEEERLNPRPSPLSTNGLPEGRLSAHNGEDVGSKPTAGKKMFFVLFCLTEQ